MGEETISEKNQAKFLSNSINDEPDNRVQLLNSVIDLCETAARNREDFAAQEVVKDKLQQIFLQLIGETEQDLRRRLAEKLSLATWAPHGLVTVLALDDIQIAQPIIASSPVLTESDLMRLLIEATLEHRIEVARRPNIPQSIVDVIIQQNQPVVMEALADNRTAEVGIVQLTRMVSASRRLAALRSSLIQHPKLSVDLAYAMYAWVGETLRRAISERFRTDESRLEALVQDVVREQRAGIPLENGPSKDRAQPHFPSESVEKLVEKLAVSRQLTPGYLLRNLREGKPDVFVAGFAKLCHIPVEEAILILEYGRSDLLALACVMIGIDRGVFLNFHMAAQQAFQENRIFKLLSKEDLANIFRLPPDGARLHFQKGVESLRNLVQ